MILVGQMIIGVKGGLTLCIWAALSCNIFLIIVGKVYLRNNININVLILFWVLSNDQ